MLEEHPAPGSPPKIKGSVMMAVAETKEEVLEALKEDVYMKVCSSFLFRVKVEEGDEF